MKKLKGKIILVDDEAWEKENLEKALQKKNWDVQVDYFETAEKRFGPSEKNEGRDISNYFRHGNA